MWRKSIDSMGIIQHRLNNQQIINTKFKKPEQIVKWLGAIQAQDFPGANWSVALRLNECAETDVLKAIEHKKIIRSWLLRGTLHYVAAEDLRWILALTAPGILSGLTKRYKQLELNEKLLSKCVTVLINSLQDGNQLTRTELTNAFKDAGINASGTRLSHILYHAGLNQIICFGARKGKQFTYTLLDEWIPKFKIKTNEEALASLADRYFISRGPATAYDFSWWSGLSVKSAKEGIELIKAKLSEQLIDEKKYWLSRVFAGKQIKANKAYLLPGFDEYLISYKDRSAVLDPKYAKKLNSGGGMLTPAIIINGRVAGTWKRTLKSKEILIHAESFVPFNKKEKELISVAAEKYGRFIRLPVKISIK